MLSLILRNYLFLSLWILTPFITFSQTFLPKSSGELISHSYYSLSYNENHEQANWVYYELTPDFINNDIGRSNNFREDKLVSSKSAASSDYSGSGFDRGHLAPAASMRFNEKSMSESFLLSNCSPQNASFNRGIWKKLEATVRFWVISEGELTVVSGPVLESVLEKIGKNGVSVPNYFYKVIYDPTDEKKMIAFLLPNKKCQSDLVQYVVSVDSVEVVTGIDFFEKLNDSLENSLESENNSGKWIFKQYNKTPQTNGKLAVQCKGFTKSGNRCKKKTKNENGYCHLHQSQAPANN